MVVPALIGAGGALLGGIFGKPKRTSAQQNSRQAILGQAQGSREAAEKYGFNPLTLLGASSAVGPSESSNYMGNAIANSAMLLADGLAKREEQFGREAALEKQNEELRLQVRELTLRPKFGGIYAQRQAVPSLGAALGRSASDAGRSARTSAVGAGSVDGGGGASDPGVSSLRPMAERVGVDPRREVEQAKQEPHSGFIAIDNPYAPFNIYVPTLDGDEALDILDAPAIGGAMLSAAWQTGRWLKDKQSDKVARRRGTPVYTVNGKRYQQTRPPLAPKGAKTRDVYRKVFGK